MSEGKREMIPVGGGLAMLPAAPGLCEVCATEHPPELPHNQQSLFYQMRFCAEHDHFPTWHDAMAHCTPEMKARWTEGLRAAGVKI